MVHFGDTIFGTDSITHCRLETPADAHIFTATSLATYSDCLHDGQAPEVLLIIVSRPVEYSPPEQVPGPMSGTIVIDTATFTTFSSL